MNIKELFRTKIFPIIVVIILVFLISFLSYYCTLYTSKIFDQVTLEKYVWINIYIHHFFQMIFAIIVMFFLGSGLKNYGFTLESEKLYIGSAVFIGVLFGVIMTLVDHLPTIISGNKISGYDLNTTNVIGWLSFEWVFAGLSEEILFRGLMMTYLMRNFSSHIKFIKWDVHIAGVIIGVLFALGHISSFWSGNLIYAIGQQLYAFILGLCYAYLYEKSQSLLSPIIAHNFSNGVEFLILFFLKWMGF